MFVLICSGIEAVTRNIASTARTSKIIVEKSTVPCRTAHSMRLILEANAGPGVDFEILSNPEFLAEVHFSIIQTNLRALQ